MEIWDFNLFKQVVAGFANMQETGDGRMTFPHIGVVINAYTRIKRGGLETEEVLSCEYCDHGKIYMEKVLSNGSPSQPYTFRCGECDPWQFKQFSPMYPARLDDYIAKGWRLDIAFAKGWGQPEDDSVVTITDFKVLGIGKENKDKEYKRQRNIKVVEQEEISF